MNRKTRMGAGEFIRITLWGSLAAVALSVAGAWLQVRVLDRPQAALAEPETTCSGSNVLTWDGADWGCISKARVISGLQRIQTGTIDVSPGGNFGEIIAECPAGKSPVGGGCQLGGPWMHHLHRNHPESDGTGWDCRSWNDRPDSNTLTLRAYAVCADAQ